MTGRFEHVAGQRTAHPAGAYLCLRTPSWRLGVGHVTVRASGGDTGARGLTTPTDQCLARRSFLKQFEGKTGDDGVEVGKDIVAVSGATVTSRSACIAVTKATILYRELYLRDGGESPKPAAAAEPESLEADDADGDGDNADAGDIGDNADAGDADDTQMP